MTVRTPFPSPHRPGSASIVPAARFERQSANGCIPKFLAGKTIRARGHRPHLEAVYMIAPRSVCRNTKKVLAERGPSIHDDEAPVVVSLWCTPSAAGLATAVTSNERAGCRVVGAIALAGG
jgi:hypothetical protein